MACGVAWGIAVVGLVMPAPAQAQQPREVRLADATTVSESTDTTETLRLTADIVDVDTGELVDVVDVEGSRDRIYDLLLKLAASLDANANAGSEAASVEASALFALGRMFEERGYRDLAADAYQAVMKYHPEYRQAADEWYRLVGRWELNAFAGLINDEPEFQVLAEGDAFRRDAVFGLRGSYHVTRHAFVQAEVANALATLVSGPSRQNLMGFPVWASAGYDVRLTHDFQLFPTLGAGAVFWSPDRSAGEVDFGLSYGVGGRLFVSRNHALRADVRLHHIPDALDQTWQDLGQVGETTLWLLELSMGVSWFPAG